MKKLSWILLSVLLVITFAVIGYFEINGPGDWAYQTPASSSVALTPIPGSVPTPLSSNSMTLIPTPTPITSFPPIGSSNGGR